MVLGTIAPKVAELLGGRVRRSTIVTVFIMIGYLVVSGIIISAVVESYGKDSIAMYLTVIAVGPIGLLLIATHKGLNLFLKRLDNHVE